MTAQFHTDMAAAMLATSKAHTAEAARLATVPPVTPPGPVNTVDRIVYCTKSPHEGAPHGVPTYWDWAQGAKVQQATPPAGMTACLGWGQIYADPANEHPAGVRVNLRNMQFGVLAAGKWQMTPIIPKFGGAHFAEDFSGNANVPWDQRTEADGSVSIDMVAGYNCHFWPDASRLAMPTGVQGFFCSVQARTIGGSAKWLGNVGGDWWKDLTAPFVGDFSNNPGIGQGRFCYLSSSWQALNFCTLSETQIRATPPPLT